MHVLFPVTRSDSRTRQELKSFLFGEKWQGPVGVSAEHVALLQSLSGFDEFLRGVEFTARQTADHSRQSREAPGGVGL